MAYFFVIPSEFRVAVRILESNGEGSWYT